ncbi:MAG: hypothetical protein QE267_07680 [Akkermansiaceae bacterium]|nr:hypothetical protein [Akkermansiaceae bacterium]
MAAGNSPGEDDFLGLAGLADFFVGDDADGHGSLTPFHSFCYSLFLGELTCGPR